MWRMGRLFPRLSQRPYLVARLQEQAEASSGSSSSSNSGSNNSWLTLATVRRCARQPDGILESAAPWPRAAARAAAPSGPERPPPSKGRAADRERSLQRSISDRKAGKQPAIDAADEQRELKRSRAEQQQQPHGWGEPPRRGASSLFCRTFVAPCRTSSTVEIQCARYIAASLRTMMPVLATQLTRGGA